MLKIDNLNKSYGKKVALKNLSLEVNDGEIFGFIGPNGAGKTTTIKCILSLINKDSGDIYINDTLVDKDYYKLNEDIGYLPSEVNLYDNMSVSEIIEYSKSFYKKDISERTEYLIRQFELDTSKKVRELSFGNLKKLGIVIALMHSPKFLILDEPTSGLDPLMQEIFFNTLKDEKERGTTIFFSSHNLSEVKRICDRVGIIKDGSIVAIEEMAELQKAILKHRRYTGDETRAEIIDEIADVEIMIEQLKIIFSCKKEVESRIDYKIERQIKRILDKYDLE